MLFKTLALTFAFAAGAAASAYAQPNPIKTYDDWTAYKYKADGDPACYVLSMPSKMEPSSVDHGKNFFVVATDGGKRDGYVPQAIMGYNLKPGSQIKVTIGDQHFVMFTKDNSAWMVHEEREPVLVDAMKSGSQMVVEATSRRGTSTSYAYSLDGITAALNTAQKCK